MECAFVDTLVVTPFVQNCRIITDAKTKRATVVDPGGEIPRVLKVLQEREANVESIFLTHAHIDHAGGVAHLLRELKSKFSCEPMLLGHPADKLARQSLEMQAQMFGLDPDEYPNCPEPTRLIDEGDVFELGGIKGEIRFVPGHCPGHVILYFPDIEVEEAGDMVAPRYRKPLCIGGDTIFNGAIGRTDLPGGDHTTLLSMIRDKMFTLPDDTVVMCGHGPNTTIGREKRTNPFFVNVR